VGREGLQHRWQRTHVPPAIRQRAARHIHLRHGRRGEAERHRSPAVLWLAGQRHRGIEGARYLEPLAMVWILAYDQEGNQSDFSAPMTGIPR
jgi:hypothetical protein